ncbi:MAG: transposase, partial [Cyanobacteria bacterium SW_9_44_58]
AAVNLRDEGLRLLSCGTRDEAYRPDVRPNRGGRKKSTIGLSDG